MAATEESRESWSYSKSMSVFCVKADLPLPKPFHGFGCTTWLVLHYPLKRLVVHHDLLFLFRVRFGD